MVTTASSPGSLIAIEGIDGAGTTTQAHRLVNWLEQRGRPAWFTCEPSAGPVGELLRRFLAGDHAPADPWTIALLFAADRMDHLRREIGPARRDGRVVVTDRYVFSSLAYQSLTVPRDFVVLANREAPPPELTLFIDVPAEVAASRRRARGGPEELFDALDLQRRIATAYRAEAERARNDGQPVAVIDGTLSPDDVFTQIANVVSQVVFPASGRDS